MKKIQIIDVIRTIGVIAVLAAHLGITYLAKPSISFSLRMLWYKMWVNGQYGVFMFFLVSGFLITRLIATSQNGLFRPSFKDFYSRRVGRIVPLLLLVCMIGALLVLFAPPSPALSHCVKTTNSPFSPYFWLSIATFWTNWYRLFGPSYGLLWNVMWSLSVEEQFYLFYPLCLLLLRKQLNLRIFLAVFIILGPVSHWIGTTFFPHGHLIQVQINSFSGFSVIAMGALLYLISAQYEEYFKNRPGVCWGLVTAGFLIFIKIYLHQPYFADYWGLIFDPFLIGLGLFLFLLGAFHLTCFNSKKLFFLSAPGKLSYGIYLFQGLVLYASWDLLKKQNELVAFTIFFVVTGGLAWFSYRFFEMPMNRLVRKWFGGETTSKI